LENNRQEKFCQEVIASCTHKEAAIRAGYSAHSAKYRAYILMRRPHVKTRIDELQQMALSSKVMGVIQRKEQLSEIAGARITDYMTADDNPDIKVSRNTPGTAAIQGLQTRVSRKEGDVVKITDLKLHDPIRAIAELNKMEGTYPPERHQIAGANGPVEIVVRYADAERKPEKPAS
jgi:phage terminase small subunit